MSNKSVREPLLHVAKRGYVPKYKSWAIRLGSIVAALIVCAVVTMLLTGENPISVYKTMFEGAFGTERKFGSFYKVLQCFCVFRLQLRRRLKCDFGISAVKGKCLSEVLLPRRV